MSASIVRCYGWRSNDQGIATTTEYILLVGVSLAIFLSLSAASSAFCASSQEDATAIAAYRVALIVSSAASEAAGSGEASAGKAIDLPGLICGMPYIVYPSPDSGSIVVDVGSGRSPCRYSAPLPLRADGVRLTGFMASPPGDHSVEYDAALRTVTLK